MSWSARSRPSPAASLPAPHPAGLLRIDHAAIKREQHLDGKWLLRTSDLTLTPDDLAAAYKQLIGLRPVFHHREDRIRAHVQLCWLALLVIRVVENATGDTWRNTRHELDRLHLVTLATQQGGRATLHPDHRAQEHVRRARAARTRPLLRLTTTSD
jgi:hypothetical protein